MSSSASDPGDSVLSTYTASDGDNIAVQDWPVAAGTRLRGMVFIVHGLGEHAWRYDHVARRLNAWGFAVRGYDQYGHGDSGGERGSLPSAMRLVDDLADLVDSTRMRMDEQTPLIVLGHSMGGLVASLYAMKREGRLDGLVLSSPALKVDFSRWQRVLLKVLPRIAPRLTVSNGVQAEYLSHDPAVVAAYSEDARVHDRISSRLAAFISACGPTVLRRAPQWRVPTLLLYAGADNIVDPAGSRAFAATAPRASVTGQCFPDFFHEIFNELDNEAVFEALRRWLDERFP